MQLFYVIVAFGSLVVLTSSKLCNQLPTNIVDDARVNMQPDGKKWQLYKSNIVGDRCLNMDWTGNRSKNEYLATFNLYNLYEGFFYSFKVNVGKNMSFWHLTDDEGNTDLYRKMIFNTKFNYFCVYSCELDGTYLKYLRCAVQDKTGEQKLNDELQRDFPVLPLRKEQKLNVVYDTTCGPKPVLCKQ